MSIEGFDHNIAVQKEITDWTNGGLRRWFHFDKTGALKATITQDADSGLMTIAEVAGQYGLHGKRYRDLKSAAYAYRHHHYPKLGLRWVAPNEEKMPDPPRLLFDPETNVKIAMIAQTACGSWLLTIHDRNPSEAVNELSGKEFGTWYAAEDAYKDAVDPEVMEIEENRRGEAALKKG